jgi:LacI family transcriptional regulator
MQRPVTIEDVALASGCSTATVSLALRNKPGVGRATRERVLAAAQSLGYQRISRPPASDDGHTLDIAVVFRTWSGDAQARAPVITGFYSWVLTGLQESAVEQGANLLLATIPVDAMNDATTFPERMLGKRLDGLIMVGSFKPDVIERVSHISAEHRTPLILVDSGNAHRTYDSIESANFDAGADATRYLIARGHRNIAWFGAMSEFEPNFRARRDGYEAALREANLEGSGIFENGIADADAIATAQLALHEAPSATAFVCCNDSFALSLMRTARQSSRLIPDDLSIIGIDDIEQSRESEPALTTLAVDKLGLGRHAMYALTNRITWPESPAMRIVLRPTLVERNSVRTI